MCYNKSNKFRQYKLWGYKRCFKVFSNLLLLTLFTISLISILYKNKGKESYLIKKKLCMKH